ncbi:MAG: hypothetical protein K6U08_06805 [Firmicutes bacterium]|nr:hypothetical protein [Bacillota bacterium]
MVGRLPSRHYYCWGCFVQFIVGDTTVEVFEVGEDGSLLRVGGGPPGRSRPEKEATSLRPGR